MKNETWKLFSGTEVTNIPTIKWIFLVKGIPKPDYPLEEQSKALLEARCLQQMPGVDYDPTYAAVVNFTSIRILLAFLAH